MSRCIYIVDDDEKICDIIRKYLERELYEVEVFTSPIPVLSKISPTRPDLFVLDIMMPGMDGFELCREIRKISNVPIIFASARGEEMDKLLGLEIGGDDFLAKPYSPRELVARVKAIFRRISTSISTAIENEILEMGNLCIEVKGRKVLCNGSEITLTTKEFDMLKYFAVTPGKAHDRGELVKELWEVEVGVNDRIVDDTIKRLRKKLQTANSLFMIQTVWGFGYKGELSNEQT